VSGIYNALEYCLQHTDLYSIVNLGNNHPVKLNELVDMIYAGLGKEKNILHEPMQPGDVDITFADISKAGALFNYKPATGMTEGIKKFIAWFEAARQEKQGNIA
jgi:nucleoside-diphosphate-sugar epimerase